MLRTENGNLKSELRKLHEENRVLRSRASSPISCRQCLEVDVACNRTNAACMRCEEAGLTCSSPLPTHSSRYPTTEVSDHEDNTRESVFNQSIPARHDWYHGQSQLPLISQSITIDGIPAYGVSSYDAQEIQSRHHTPYDVEDDDESFQRSYQGDYTNLLQPNIRQMHRSQSLQTLAVTNEQSRPRSSSLYRPSIA